jgi:hypothetical protein
MPGMPLAELIGAVDVRGPGHSGPALRSRAPGESGREGLGRRSAQRPMRHTRPAGCSSGPAQSRRGDACPPRIPRSPGQRMHWSAGPGWPKSVSLIVRFEACTIRRSALGARDIAALTLAYRTCRSALSTGSRSTNWNFWTAAAIINSARGWYSWIGGPGAVHAADGCVFRAGRHRGGPQLRDSQYSRLASWIPRGG